MPKMRGGRRSNSRGTPYRRKRTPAPRRAKIVRKKKASVRAPLVECKIRECQGTVDLHVSSLHYDPSVMSDHDHGGDMSGTRISTLIIPHSFQFMERGLKPNEMVGNDVFSKWVRMNVQVDYSQCHGYQGPITYQVIQGWCKEPLNPTTAVMKPLNNGCTQPEVVEVRDKTLCEAHVKKIMDKAYADPLMFGNGTDIKIIKRTRVVAKPTFAGVVAGAGAGAAPHQTFIRPNKLMKFKWTPMRKIQYEPHHANPTGTINTPSYVAGHDYFACWSGNWIPFVYFQPEMQHLGGAGAAGSTTVIDKTPIVRYVDRHYFTDS